jgi:UDP-2,3-diacylglucosamine pyrophosphatase LpxH
MEKIRTLFVSDLHLGNSNSKASSILDVFHEYEFENLFIIGDFIDLTSLKRKFWWHKDHSTIIQKILRYSRKGVNVVYIIGNHDFYIRHLINEEFSTINIGDIHVCNEYVYKTLNDEKIYITHGDEFDGFVRIHPFLYILGSIAYDFSIRINKNYNFFRKIFGLQYWSLSSYLKHKVKDVMAFVNQYEKMSELKVKEKKCDSLMMGHTHFSKFIKGKYYNTGNMFEDCTFIIEKNDGEMRLIIK